jgi:hypothetical protein
MQIKLRKVDSNRESTAGKHDIRPNQKAKLSP